ncbi:uncharacterized protein LOC117521201 [Thalassophryne amazonica]|uniref:uncharacterized protein LOC117521201 n=1 Tax=Thalassophryne amazonica TaxID=390379 RepID=UPI001471899F|nr:uncharacterized protein LOC117521201 [Thalassophryne amazonica]
MLDKNLNYRSQLLHSAVRQHGFESSTHLKINYNDLLPVVAGLHWRSPCKNAVQKKWEGTLSVYTPWLYVYTAHSLRKQQRHTLQLTSELTASKWLTVRNLLLQASYMARGSEKEARLHLSTTAVIYLQAGGWAVVGKRSVKASCWLTSMWTPPLRGDVFLEALKFSQTLQMASSCGKHNISLSAALSAVDKILRKRYTTLLMTFSDPNGLSKELQIEGAVQEVRKDKKMYQKTALLQLRSVQQYDLCAMN